MNRWVIVALWLGVILTCSLWIAFNGKITSDLSVFLPRAATPQQQVLVEQLKSGLQTRLILVGLHGRDSKALAKASRGLSAALREKKLFQAVYNGARTRDLDKLTWRRLESTLLFRYRFLLDPAVGPGYFTVRRLHNMLRAALVSLASPAATFTRALLPADPGGIYLRLLKKLAPAKAPRHLHGVWFAANGKTALLVAETAAPGFGLAGQTQAVAAIRGAFAGLPGAGQAKLWLTGPAVFAASARNRIRREATLLSAAASVAMVIFLIIVLRSLRAVALSIVPLVTGVLVGIAVVIVAFGSMYGITLAFGATLLGVAIDYPLHFFAHRDAEAAPEQTIRSIRTTLWLGVATTAIGYFAMLFSGIGGLAELALFAIVGLTAAAAATCWVLPSLAGNWHERRLGQPAKQWRLPRRHARVFIVCGIAGAAVVYLIATSNPIWQTDPAKLSPLPAAQLRLDRVLRHAFHAPDFNRLIAVTAASEEGALDKLDGLRLVLNRLKRRGALAGYSLLTDVLPSRAAQRKRQAAIPPPAEMRRRLQRARAGLAFKKGVFAPFLADLERSRKLPLLNRAHIQDSAMALRVDAELKRVDRHWQAIVPLRRVRKPQDIETALAEHDPRGVYYIDVKHVSSEMLTNYRVKAVRLFLIGSALTVLVLLISLKNFARTLRVLMSAYSAALVTAAILVAAGIALTLFHLVSLLLVIGLGLDYGLFFNRDALTPVERRRTVRGVIVCNISTVLVFGLLALAVTPVLQAIGATVALGAVLSLVFAGLLAPPMAGDRRR